jgi:hypothetical protein
VWTAESVFVCALALLGRSPQSFPATQFVETAPLSVARTAAAYVSRDGDPHIVLITSTTAFVSARAARTPCSDLDAIREIAAVLAHEQWHIRHGADEEGAYDAQLTTLMFLGVSQDSALYQRAKRSRDAVLVAARRASQTPVVAHAATPGLDNSAATMPLPSRNGR